jgi:hypothetical protein
VNLYTIIGLAFFWVYACYGAVSIPEERVSGFLAVLFALIFSWFMERGRTSCRNNFGLFSWLKYLGTGLGFALILAVLAWRELHAGLVTDAFYHTGLTTAHGQRLLRPDLVPSGSRIYRALHSVPYGEILHLINIALFTLVGYGLLQIRNIRNQYARWVWFVLFFLGARFLTRSYVLEGDIHPPLRLLPMALSSLVGGVHEFAFRLPGIVALGGFGALLVYLFRNLIGSLGALVAAGGIISLPLVWHGGLIVEASIWSAMALGTVGLFLLASDKTERPIPYQLLFAVLALASVMRQSTFVALVPLGFIYLWDLTRQKMSWRERGRKIFEDCCPALLVVPWTLHIARTGTPATDHSGTPWTHKMEVALASGAALEYFRTHWRWPGFALICVGLLPQKSKAYFFVIGTICLSLGLFYSIKPDLWGLARYQLEIGFAVLCLGVIQLLTWWNQIFPRHWKLLQVGILTSLGAIWISFNYLEFRSIRKIHGRFDGGNLFVRSRDGSIPSLAEYSFPISKSLEIAKAQGVQRGLFIDGISYGVMPQVLAGYAWDEVRSAEELPAAWEGADPEKVHRFPRITSIMLVDWKEDHNSRSADTLKKLGWYEVARIPDEDVPDNIILLLRRP